MMSDLIERLEGKARYLSSDDVEIHLPDTVALLREAAAALRAQQPQPIATAPRDGWEPTHIHYKGGEYRVLFEALQTDQTPAGAHVVVYDNREGQCFVRPKFMFIEPGRFTSTPPQEK
jgi:hypothetical protein